MDGEAIESGIGVRIAAELAIRELVARYADAVARVDREAWLATWADDARWDLGAVSVEGKDAIGELWTRAMAGFEFVVQLPASGVIDVSEDANSARGRWYLTEHGRSLDGTPMLTIGVYEDDYRQDGGVWGFACRRFQSCYAGPPDLSAPRGARP